MGSVGAPESEKWEPVRGYEDTYEVSSFGRVRSIDRVVTRTIDNGYGSATTFSQRVRGTMLSISPSKYPQVSLCKHGVCERLYVHILVAEHFISPRPKGVQVCHTDGDPTNSRVSNLRYDTPKGNAGDRPRHGTDAIGSNNPCAKLNEEQVKEIKKLLRSKSCQEIARMFGVALSTIKSIRLGYRWVHV